MSGFENQTYTQVPNSLFLIMKDMDECELKVVMYICRMTFGYHRDAVKISTRDLAQAIGMNTASVCKGAEAAVIRGLIEKVISGQNTTEWHAIVTDGVSEIESLDPKVIQRLNRSDSENESQVGLNKDKEKNINNESKPKIELPVGADIGWLINHDASAEEIEKSLKLNQDNEMRLDCYERSMGYNPLGWSSRKLERLANFLFTKSIAEIETFAVWCRQPFSPLSPAKARQFPDMVIDLWPQAFPKVIPTQERKPGEGFYA
jgi:hypothetical protein